MKIFLLLLFFLFSCNSVEPAEDLKNLELKSQTPDFVWVCHHPGSDYHNQICVDEIYPDGCYVLGDRSKFCWILSSEDCKGNLDKDWQILNCPKLLGK